MKQILFLLLTAVSISAFGQSKIVGHVYYQSSGSKPAVGVKVSADGSNGDYSKSEGDYTLEFPHLYPGAKTDPYLGENNFIVDIEGTELELSEKSVLISALIPIDPLEAPLDIIVCTKGTIAREKNRLKKLMLKNDRESTAIVKLENRVDSFIREKVYNFQLIDSLNKVIFDMKTSQDTLLSIHAEYLARLNTDGASKKVIMYLSCIENGGTIEDCRNILNPEEANEQASRNVSSFKQNIHRLELAAEAATTIFDYENAIRFTQYIINHFEEVDINPVKVSSYYENIGNLLRLEGHYDQSLSYLEKCLKIYTGIYGSSSIQVGNAHHVIASSFSDKGKYDFALLHHKKCVKIYENELPNTASLALAYANMGHILRNQGKLDSSLVFQLKALSVSEHFQSVKLDVLSGLLGEIGLTYELLHRDTLAIKYYNESLEICKNHLPDNHPQFSLVYGLLGSVYAQMKNHEKALTLFDEYLIRNKKLFGEINIERGLAYNHIGNTYLMMSSGELALENLKKGQRIFNLTIDANHPYMYQLFNNLGNAFAQTGPIDSSFYYYNKSFETLLERNEKEHPHMAMVYYGLGRLHSSNNIDSTLFYFKLSNSIYNKFANEYAYDQARVTASIGYTFEQKELYDSSLVYYNKCLRLYELLESNIHERIDLHYKCAFISAINLGDRSIALYNINEFNSLSESNVITESSDLGWLNGSVSFKQKVGLINSMHGKILINEKKYRIAMDCFEKAALLIPEIKKSFYYNNVGQCYAHTGKMNKAYNSFKIFEELFPEDPKTYRNWVLYFAIVRDNHNAYKNLVKALELGFNDLEWLKSEEKLKSIRNTKKFKKLIQKLK